MRIENGKKETVAVIDPKTLEVTGLKDDRLGAILDEWKRSGLTFIGAPPKTSTSVLADGVRNVSFAPENFFDILCELEGKGYEVVE